MIHSMELEQFTIIKVNKYICNQVQGQSKRVVILLEVSVVTPGDQVHEKLGNPVPMDGAGNIVQMGAGNSLSIGIGNVLPMGARNPDGRSWNFRADVQKLLDHGDASRKPLLDASRNSHGGG